MGLVDTAVRESRDRVRAALKNSGFKLPAGRITVNLAPADLKKQNPVFDLPIFVSIATITEDLKINAENTAFVGELSLNGKLRPVSGILPMVIAAKQHGVKRFFLPIQNYHEASIVKDIEIIAVTQAKEAVQILTGEVKYTAPQIDDRQTESSFESSIDFSDVLGQVVAKRAAVIAAAGGHNLLMIGPPGSGKSMIAKRIPTILPPMTFDEAIETTKIVSVSNANGYKGLVTERPFRSPHHTASIVSLTGGGSNPSPGELSLAHNGVLFLDELPHFERALIETLRSPLEDSVVTVSRAKAKVTYPCNIILIAAMNPCPCGFLNHPQKKCSCRPFEINRYLHKISGPIVDRIDLQVFVSAVNYDDLQSSAQGESSESIRLKVRTARERQIARFKGENIYKNSDMTSSMTKKYCHLDETTNAFLKKYFEKFNISARSYEKILKVARTIADLEGKTDIDIRDISEALSYRAFDKMVAARNNN